MFSLLVQPFKLFSQMNVRLNMCESLNTLFKRAKELLTVLYLVVTLNASHRESDYGNKSCANFMLSKLSGNCVK